MISNSYDYADDGSRIEPVPSRPPAADPVPLKAARRPAPFPVDALPGWAASYVAGLSTFTQTPPDLAAVCVLGVLAAAAGGRAVVEARSGWREPVNVYLLPVMPPGSRKSAVISAATRPLYEVERSLIQIKRPQIMEAETLRGIATKNADRARQAASQVNGEHRDKLNAEAIAAAAAAESIEVPALPRLIADDVTPEAAATLLADHGGRLAIISAEGGIFDTFNGRYSGGIPQLDVLLKAHAGDPLRVDRKGRPPEHIDAPALTMLLTAQPAVLAAIARNNTFRGRGLLARILYAIPANNVGYRRVGADPVPAEVAETYALNVRNLAERMVDWTDPAVLTLDPAARELLLTVEREIEPQLAPEGTLGVIAEWGSKLVGAVLRIAGLLHLAGGPDAIRRPITSTTLADAVRIGAYFTDHARAAFDLLGEDSDNGSAAYVLEHLRRKRAERFTIRDLHVDLPRGRFPKVETVTDAVEVLDAHGWVTLIPAPEHDGPGRKPSPAYAVHPATHSAQSTQSTEPPTDAHSVGSVVSVDTSANGNAA
ncbi:MAG: YfjI family protein [Mycobacteriales bacterium]